MPCIEPRRRAGVGFIRFCKGVVGFGLIAGCSTSLREHPVPTNEAPPERGSEGAAPALPPSLPLAPPSPVHNWDDVRLQAARRLIAANPASTYTEPAPDALLAIPVLQIDLNADGSIRRIEALRLPTQAKETTQLAIEALRRAAPFGDVSRLPKPWRFVETFLFNDERKFKPRTLD